MAATTGARVPANATLTEGPLATRVLAETRSWPDAAADKTGGSRRRRDEIATAAANGDPGTLRDDLKANCPPSWTRSSDR